MSWQPDPTLLYKPLPDGHIRVLQLHGCCLIDVPGRPGVQDYAVRCGLKSFRLLDPTSGRQARAGTDYTALSYVWGNTSLNFGCHILCDNVVLPVTVNLAHALRQIVLDADSLPLNLWVDAVCINQSDQAEKGKQIALMGDIYRQAYYVLIWLGTGLDLRGAEVESLLKYLSDDTASVPPSDDILASATEYLLSNEWCTRAWTFQEIVLARRPLIQVGPYRISWDRLVGAASAQNAKLEAIEECRKSQGYDSMLKLIDVTWDRKAWDERDKIFSLLGLYRGNGRIKVDLGDSAREVRAKALAAAFGDLGCLFFQELLPLEPWKWESGQGAGGLSTKPGTFHHSFQFRGDEDTTLDTAHSWLYDWSESPTHMVKKVSMVHDSTKPAFNFTSLSPDWTMNWKLEGSNMIAAGAICGEFITFKLDDQWLREFRPLKAGCLPNFTMADLLAWSKEGWGGIKRSRNKQQGFLSSNDFYSTYVRKHCMEKSCGCYNRAQIMLDGVGGKMASLFKKRTPELLARDQDLELQDHDREMTTMLETAAPSSEEMQSSSFSKQQLRSPIYLAVVFGSKAPSVVQPFWNTKLQRYTFRVRKYFSPSHPWTNCFGKLANGTPFELGATRDEEGNKTTYDQQWFEFMFKQASFLPIYFEFE